MCYWLCYSFSDHLASERVLTTHGGNSPQTWETSWALDVLRCPWASAKRIDRIDLQLSMSQLLRQDANCFPQQKHASIGHVSPPKTFIWYKGVFSISVPSGNDCYITIEHGPVEIVDEYPVDPSGPSPEWIAAFFALSSQAAPRVPGCPACSEKKLDCKLRLALANTQGYEIHIRLAA